MKLSDEQAEFWKRFCSATGHIGLPFDVFAFGDSPEMADDLLALVLSGQKRATATRLKVYELEGFGPPCPGDLSLILDGHNKPACVIETTKAPHVPFEDVDAEFAYIEGEGDRSLEYWRRVHLAYYARECVAEGSELDARELIVCEQFKCIWPLDRT